MLKTSYKILIASIACSLLLSPSLSAKVYKWVDKDGKVHYSDHPQDENAQATQVNDNPKSRANSVSAQNARARVETFQSQMQAKQEQEAKLAKENQENQAKKDKLCGEAKGRLALLNEQGRMFKMNEKGEREYYSDEDRAKAITETEEIRNASCPED